jgi:membrane associated rhomboid family serine protease
MSEFRFTRPDSFPPVVKNLIIINVLVWVAQLVFADQNLTFKIALHPIDSPYFEPYQIATHMFAHAAGPGQLFHIFFNMFALYMFGRILENVWGHKRFLLFYILCGVGAAACHLLVQHLRYDETLVQEALMAQAMGQEQIAQALVNRMDFLASAVGASGAVMGILAGFALLFPNTELYLMFIPIPIKAKWMVLGLIALDLFGGFSPTANTGIAHFAHLGGAITGFIIVMIWNKTNRKTLY